MSIRKVELEITSDCNAACPGCARTQNLDKFSIEHISLLDIQLAFPKEAISGVKFKLCGVLGDPAKHKNMTSIVQYIVENGGKCEISTNGGLLPEKDWETLGSIATNYPSMLHIHFCVDGHELTNHIYRVNTKFSVIKRNMEAYSRYAPEKSATWIFIVFDHNEKELNVAKKDALSLNFNFATRTGMRNSYHDWVSLVKKRNVTSKKIDTTQTIITTTGKKEHSKKEEVYELDQFIDKYTSSSVTQDETTEVLNSIVCKYVHEQELFIASNLTVWPCCFLWDSHIKNKDNINDKLSQFDKNWNSLQFNTLDDILSHKWYKELLRLSWNPSHSMHLSRCIRTCAKHKAYHNEIILDNE